MPSASALARPVPCCSMPDQHQQRAAADVGPIPAGSFRQDTLDRLVFGIRKVLQGSTGSAPPPLCDLVDYYRRHGQPQRQQTLLTAREQGDRASPDDGASNTEIADSLFVSEHTVKSHLYNVFKKLNVKNRLQAVSWAKEYL